jgi:hypothetical protein
MSGLNIVGYRATGHVHAKNRPMKLHEDICVFSEGNTLHINQSVKRMLSTRFDTT